MSTKILYNGQNKENARYLRKNMTRQERKIWYDFLKNHKYKWYRQRRIGNYIVDFYCDKLHLVIEIDGGQHYEERQKAYDEERTKMLMIYHKIYNSWAWVGGHSDGDSDLLYVAMKEAKEETGIKNVAPISNDIYSLEIINVNGHEKRGKYVGSHVHLNVTYLLEADENEEIHIKEDENSGVKWVPIDEVLNITSEIWIRDRVYTKIIEKMKKDGII